MRLFKRTVSFVLSLALIIGTLTVTAFNTEAATTLEKHDSTHDGWEVWDGTGNLTSGNYYLNEDISLSAARTVSGTVTLCLNGHNITNSGTGHRAFTTSSGAVFTICDCDEDEHGSISGFALGTSSDTYGGFIYVDKGSTFNLHDITVSECTTKQGGAVFLQSGDGTNNGGIFNMYSGTITGNTAQLGGGLYISNSSDASHSPASFNMYGGTISDNTANRVNSTNGLGGGIYSNGNVNIDNGTISGNTAYNGGGICTAGTTNELTITDSEISDNVASNQGGGLVSTGTTDVTDTVFDGNVGKYGGNVRVSSGNASFTRGEIKNGDGNHTDASGASIHLNNASSEVTLTGTDISGISSKHDELNIYIYLGTLVVNGGTISSRLRAGAKDKAGNVIINGGTFLGNLAKGTDGTITVNGGWFKSSVSSFTMGAGKTATGSCADAPNPGAKYTVDDSATYTLTYKLPDETLIGAEVATPHGTTVEIDGYSASGYRFDGWYLDAACKDDPAPFAAGDSVELSHDMTVYAKRTAVFTVTVNIYDGSGALSSTNNHVEEAGEIYTYTVPAAPAITYYTFDGYALTQNGEVAYQPGDTINYNSDNTLNLYPIYTELFLATLGGVNYHTVQDAANALTADDQTITLTNAFPGATAITIENVAHPFTLDLNGKTVSGTSDASTRPLYVHHADVTVVNGSISSNDRTSGRGGIYIHNNTDGTNPGGSRLVLGSGLTVSGTTTGQYGFVGTYGPSSIIVDGATLQNMTSATSGTGIYIAQNGNLTIKSGSVIDTMITYNSAITIEDGLFGENFSLSQLGSGSITTTGGWYYTELSNAYYDTSSYEWQADTETHPGYAGHIAERDTTVYLVRNNTTGESYTSLDDAITGLTASGQTLELLEDFSFSSDITIASAPYAFTLDLGGNTLTGVSGNTTSAVTVTNSTVTITNGTININKGDVARAAVNVYTDATVTLGSGLTISGTSTRTSNNLGITGTGYNTASLIIDGAVISGTDGNGYSIVTANNGSIRYVSGTVVGKVHMNNGTTNISGGNFQGALTFASGASVSITGGNYVTEPSESLVALGYAWSTSDVPAGYNGKITYVDTYTISYYVDGNIVSGMTTQVTRGKSVSAPDYTDKMYYTLDGWANTSDGAVVYEVGDPITPAADMTVHGKFTELPLTASTTIGGTTTDYHFFYEAFDAANVAGQTSTVTLLGDASWSSATTVGTDAAGGPTITLDLNGHNLTQSGNARLFDIRKQSTVTVTDTSISGNGRIYAAQSQAINGLIINRGTLVVSGGTIETAASWSLGDVLYCSTNASATITITGGTIVTQGTLPAVFANNGTVSISGGFIKSAGAADLGKAASAGTFEINGGWFAHEPAASYISSGYGWRDDDTSNTGYSGVVLPIYHVNFYVDSVLDGDLSRDVIGEQSVTAPSYSKAYYTFHGWAESASSDPEDVVFEADDAISVNADKNLYAVLVEYDKLASLKIGSDEPTEYYYFSEAFTAAIAAGEACSIQLLGDDTVSATLSVPDSTGADITIDLNSHQITNDGTQRLLLIGTGNTVTITDTSGSGTGRIYSASDSDQYGVIYNRGILNISGGTIQADGNRSNANGIYMTTNPDAELNITGGTFITAGTNPVIDVYNGAATITGGTFITAGTTFAVKAESTGTVNISNGFFKSAGTADVGKSNTGSMSITGGWFAKAPTAYFDNANYGWVTDGTHSELGFAGYVSALGLYVKNTTTNDTYKTIAAAVAALSADGQTIQLLAGFNGNVDVNISRASHTFILDLNGNTVNGISAGTTTLSVDNSELTVINGTISGNGKTSNRSAVYAQNGAVITLGAGLTVSGTGTGAQGLVGAYSDDSGNPATIIVDGASITGKAASNYGLRVTTNGVLNFISGTLAYNLSLFAGRTVISGGFFGGSILKDSGAVLSITGGWYASIPSTDLYDTTAYEWETDSETYPGYAGQIKELAEITYVVENTDKDVQYPSLDAAILGLDSAGQTLVLLEDFDFASDISIASAPYAFTLDLGGYTFTGDPKSNTAAIRVNVSTVTITNGTINVTKGAVRRAAINVMRLGAVTLGSGLTISGTCSESFGLVGLEGDATSLTMAGATVNGTDSNDRGLYIVNSKPFYMTSGNVVSDIFFGSSTVNISGGVISGDLGSSNAATINITGGYFGGNFAPNASAVISITGGYFKDSPASRLTAGYNVETLETAVNGCTYHVIHLEVDAASITLANQLAINYYCTVPDDSYSGQAVYMIGECAGEEFRVNGTLISSVGGKHFEFTFDGIDPRWLSEDIDAEYYLGNTKLNEKTYSVAEYCADIYARIQRAVENEEHFTDYDDKLLNQIADMLLYGKAAQIYKGYNTNELCTRATVSYDGETRTVTYGESDLSWITSNASSGDLAENFTNLAVLYAKNSNLTGLVNGVSAADFDIVGATCMFGTGGYVVPRFLINLDENAFGLEPLPAYEDEEETIDLDTDNFNIDSENTLVNARIKVTRAGSTGSSEATRYYGINVNAVSYGHYYIDLGLSGDTGFQFYPYQFGEKITVTLQLKTTAGKWRSVQAADYSVNSYCLDKSVSSNANMAAFAEAVLWYGKSSAALYTAMHSGS